MSRRPQSFIAGTQKHCIVNIWCVLLHAVFCSSTWKFWLTPHTIVAVWQCSIALFDVIDCYTLQHSEWCGLCCCEGELCRPPCENGGRCLANEKGDWRCYCWPDFSGERCEVNHCTDYCLNGGTCMGSPLGRSTSNPSIKHRVYGLCFVILL